MHIGNWVAVAGWGRKFGCQIVRGVSDLVCILCLGFVLTGESVQGASSYWDGNGAAAGAGTTPTGNWGVDAFWSTDASGTSAPATWTNGDTAVFSAGTDAVNPFTVTVSGNQGVAGVTFQEGNVMLSGGIITVSNGAAINVTPPSATVNSVLAGWAFTKSGAGTLLLNGTNTFSGLLTLSAGVIVIGNNTALGNSGGGTTIGNGAALHVSGNRTVAEPISLIGTGVSGGGVLLNLTGSNTFTGTITITGNARFNSDSGTLRLHAPVQALANNYQLTVGGAGDTIMAGNTFTGQTSKLTKDGAGVLTITAACNQRGGTVVSAGTLRLGANDVIRSGTSVLVNGTFDLNGFNSSVDSLTGSGIVTNGGTLTLGGTTVAPIFFGVISGATAVTKVETNLQILSGNHTYVGATTVSNGTLRLNGSLAAGSAVSVQSGATLDGTGTINGSVTVAAGGNLGPGTSTGTMTLGGGLDLSAGGAYVWELAANSTNLPGTDFDRLVLTGGHLSLGGASTLNIQFIGVATTPDTNNAFWQTNRTWKIIASSGGANPGNTKFASIANGSFAAGFFATSADPDGGISLHYHRYGLRTNEIDFATVTGRAFPSGVRGQNPYRSMDAVGFNAAFNMSKPSLMRGIAGGLDADTYDWRVYNSGSKWGATAWGTLVTTLDYLRRCRDTRSEPLLTANIFGGGYTNESGTMICQFDNFTNRYNPGGWGTNAVTGTAAQLAADWVRYCNLIVPAYRQGQEDLIGHDPNFNATDNAENLRVYNSLALGGNWAGRDVLLTNGEPAVPRVVWWEIGNEPEVDLAADSTLVNQHVIPDKYVYRDRYRIIATAMKAVDASIRTGPCITSAYNGNEWLGRVAEDTNAPMDFVGIHPYYSSIKVNWPNPTNMTTALLNIGRVLSDNFRNTALTISNYAGPTRFGTKPEGWFWNVPLVASEYNPVNWDATSTIQRSTAAGLGLVEHCFRFAHPNRATNDLQSLLGANYWENPSGRVALTNAFEALRDFAGDVILENPYPGPQPIPDFGPMDAPMRIYVTRQTNGGNQVHVWALNFSEDTDLAANLIFTNLPFTVRQVIQRTFARPGAENSLTNSTGLGWTARDVTGSINPSNLTFTVENAGFSIVTLQEIATTNWYWDTSKFPGLQGGNGTWSTNHLNMNWSSVPEGETPVLAWKDGMDAVFDAALSAGGTITVTETVSPRLVTVNKSNCNFAGDGTISLGAGGMQINAPISVTNAAANPLLSGFGGVMANPGNGNSVVFNCTNTYTGDTVIGSGTFTLGARGGIPNTASIILSNGATLNATTRAAGFVLLAGQTLTGSGSVAGTTTIQGTVSPGASVGTLRFSTNLSLAGTTLLDVGRSGPAVTNDSIFCSNVLTFGGALIVTNSGSEPLTAGNTFALFTAPTNHGAFSHVQLPPLGYGLAWNTNGLGSGVVQVVLTVPVFSSVALLGDALVLNGSNGVNGAEYYLLTATNVALPLSNWTRVLTNYFGAGGEFSETLPVGPADVTRFFRLQSP